MSHPDHQAQPFFENGIRVVKVVDWLNWASSSETKEGQWAVMLPMIQRGSVWKPHQVIDLWDTILRGMPFGGLMASHIPASSGTKFFRPLDRKLDTLSANGGLSLIDGQQRTLAMLIAWPEVGTQMQRRIWIDFGEDDKFDHLLRLHFTSESSPLGYQRGGPSGENIRRLSLGERRTANAAYADLMPDGSTATLVHHDEISPWNSTLALDLRKLIKGYRDKLKPFDVLVRDQAKSVQKDLASRLEKVRSKQNPFEKYDDVLLQAIINHLEARSKKISEVLNASTEFDQRIQSLADGIGLMFKQHFPIIEVREDLMRAEEADEAKDPPLAVLLKRIGTGGTDLKSADYVFSVIKHVNPECHTLVEDQLKDRRIAAIYSATALVMSAVRLTAAAIDKSKDYSKIDKAAFTRLIRGDKKAKLGDSEKSSFLTQFNEQIRSHGRFVKNLGAILAAIAYVPDKHPSDIGLPLHALSLVDIPALEVILFWLHARDMSDVEEHRLSFIRFLLCWHLTVSVATKASRECFRVIAADHFDVFPDNVLFQALEKLELALPVRRPQELLAQQVLPTRTKLNQEQSAALIYSADTVAGLRGWRRFAPPDKFVDEADRLRQQQTTELYKRWWNLRGGYSHALLLWLQRDYIHRKFKDKHAQPGMEDDTPYDFDHICPANHWHGWQGSQPNKLTEFPAEDIVNGDAEGYWRLGNAIGNVRVWDSSDNRSDGDAAPAIKLKITATEDSREVLCDSAISFTSTVDLTDEREAWKLCGPERQDEPKKWSQARALAFQKAIELRTFNLYQRFYLDLEFANHAKLEENTK